MSTFARIFMPLFYSRYTEQCMLVLASQSPRRSEILRNAGIEFTVRVSPVDESELPLERPAQYVRRLAEAKARAIEAASDEIVLAADTTVVSAGEVLGKPIHE